MNRQMTEEMGRWLDGKADCQGLTAIFMSIKLSPKSQNYLVWSPFPMSYIQKDARSFPTINEALEIGDNQPSDNHETT